MSDKAKLSEMQPMEYLVEEDKSSSALWHSLREYALPGISFVAFIALIAAYIIFPRFPPAMSHDLSVSNRTLGFQKIFVLNVPTRVDQKDILTVVASVTDLDFEFWAASSPDSIPDRGLPDGAEKFGGGARGEWISQMSIYQYMVDHNIASALILEEDADWDIRLREQLNDFAKASLILNSRASAIDRSTTTPNLASEAIHFESLPNDNTPHTSPYGDRWDVLWFGHLGARMIHDDDDDSNNVIYHSYVVQHNDSTVTQYSQQKSLDNSFWNVDLATRPDHTRLYYSSIQGVGTQAYAISLAGARRALYSMNIDIPIGPIDIILRYFCQNTYTASEYHALCITTSPSLFSQYKSKGSTNKDSNINDFGGGFREKGEDINIRYSVRNNLPELLNGGTNFVDQYPDGDQVNDWTEED